MLCCNVAHYPALWELTDYWREILAFLHFHSTESNKSPSLKVLWFTLPLISYHLTHQLKDLSTYVAHKAAWT